MDLGFVCGSVAFRMARRELSLASYRYRARDSMRELRARGHLLRLVWRQTRRVSDTARAALEGADVAIFAKNHSEPSEVIALLELAPALGVATIVDTCDDYFAADDKNLPTIAH